MIIKLLKDLSVKKNVASMVIIHQPDPEVFALFDRLILLSRGHTMFSGPCSDLSAFYKSSFNEPLPSHYNLAKDLITRASTWDPTTMSSFGSDIYEVDALSSRQDGSELKLNNEDAFEDNVAYDLGRPPISFHEFMLQNNKSPTEMWKLMIVFKRNLTNQYIRNIGNVGARIVSYAMISVIIGMIFWNVGDTDSKMGLDFEEAGLVVRSSIFLMNISYLLPFATIPVFVNDKKFFAAESALGLYSPWMYAASELFLEFVFVTLASVIEACIVINMCAMWNPVVPAWASFLSLLAVLIMSGLVGSTLILCASMWLPTQDLSFVLSSTIVTIALALCGGFRPASDMPDVPYSLQWFSPIKYSYQGLLISLLTGTSSERLLYVQEFDAPSTVTGNLIVSSLIFVGLCFFTGAGMARIKEAR